MKKFNIDENELCNWYKNSLICSDIDIKKKFNICQKTFYNILFKHNIDRKGRGKRMHSIDVEYFNNIDSFEKAHILGLIYADGHIQKDGYRLKIELRLSDSYYLEIIREKLKSQKKLVIRQGKNKKFGKENRIISSSGSSSLIVNSRKFVDNIKLFGITNNKTYETIIFPKISKDLYNGFLLGFFEGDGWISFINNKGSISIGIIGQENIINQIKEILDDIDIKSYIGSDGDLKVISVSKIESIIKLYHFLYKNANFVMERKYKKWLEGLEILKMKGYDTGNRYSFTEQNNL